MSDISDEIWNDYADNFNHVLFDAAKKYDLKKSLKAESWKTLPLHSLRFNMCDEIGEWLVARGLDNEYDELLDVVNLALMLAERILHNTAQEESQ